MKTQAIVCEHAKECQCRACVQEWYDRVRSLFDADYPEPDPEPAERRRREFEEWLSQDPPAVVPEIVP